MYELLFIKCFVDLGFKWDVYVNIDDLEGFIYGLIIFVVKIFIKEKCCFIFKRWSFFYDYMDMLN